MRRQETARPASPEVLTRAERGLLRALSSPARIQAYLDELAYRPEDDPGCPRRVMREGKANCFDGAVFGAFALRRIGHAPLLLDMWAVRDDDHVLAVFREDGHYGAVAKSNFVGLRFREPVYRTLRELVLSYFEDYFNAAGEKTLRSWSSLLDLSRLDHLNWAFRDEPLRYISDRLDALVHRRILTRKMERRLTPVDPRSLRAGMLGVLAEGLYQES
ncbi:MAG TPA: hypothetical protein VMK42_03570 [Anaeromyxobacteraceae bacterium]|nr:hypothetical protein [Anaeromyxobacteraceae bacterium]